LLIFANLTVSFLAPPAAQAATTSGSIFLRGVVPERGFIGVSSPIASRGTGTALVPGAPVRMAFDLGPVSANQSTAVFHLNRLANSSSGFVVTLNVGGATGDSLAMTGDNGVTLPYQIRFGGRDVEFTEGEAELATVTRDTQDDEASGLFEIVAPPIPAASGGISDHIVLTIAAR
jgi:hypothetical protein